MTYLQALQARLTELLAQRAGRTTPAQRAVLDQEIGNIEAAIHLTEGLIAGASSVGCWES